MRRKLDMFENKRILITGGTGSFGSNYINNILKNKFGEILVFSRDEKKQHDMREKLNNKKVRFIVGDIRNHESIYDATKNVDYVFNAAALKQVPSCEFHPLEAVRTNILGSENIIRASIANKVKSIVLMSTDKAVYPINAMGQSKALMEKIGLSYSRQFSINSFSKINIVRYGNVIASRGSVIPLFIEQIKNNLPITITNPRMTRFLMSLDDSVDLISHALEAGKNGSTYVRKAKSCYIIDLASAIFEITGKTQKINIIGDRHGEKLNETLVSKEEIVMSKETKKYFEIPIDPIDNNYNKYFTKGKKLNKEFFEYNSKNTEILNKKNLIELLKKNKQVQELINAF